MNGKLVGFVLLLAVVLGGVWFLTQGDPGGERRREVNTVGPAETSPEVPRESGAEELELDRPIAPEGSQRVAETTSEPTPRRAAVEAADSNVDEGDTVWLDVTLTLPPGLPLSDQPALLALARLEEPMDAEVARELIEQGILTSDYADVLEEEDVAWSRRPIAGTALRVPFHKDGTIGHLILQSDYLYHDPVTVEIVESMKPVHLEPKLGGLLTGRILFPAGMDERGIEKAKAELELAGRITDSGFEGWRNMDSRDVDVEDDDTYRVTRLSPERTYLVKAETEGLATWTDMELRVQPGEHRVLDIALEYGATISGTVAGDDGKPISGASVSTGNRGMFFGGNRSEATTDEDGNYTITGVSAGKTRIEAKKSGWKESEDQTLDVQTDQLLTGIDFVLERGLSIAGSVTWPDGKPAADARVKANVTRNGGWRQEASSTNSLADGTFELTGLEETAYEVRVEAKLTEEDARRLKVAWKPEAPQQGEDIEELGGFSAMLGRQMGGGANRWVGRESGVAIGTTNVRIVLAAPLTIQGQVIDGAGDPVVDYQITAKPEGASRWSFQDTSREKVNDPSGMFELSVPFEGKWTLSLESEKYVAEKDGTEVVVPSSEPVTLVMNLAGKLTGVVVDPFGAPIAGAEVTGLGSEEAANPFFGNRGGKPEKTDDQGQFELKAPGDRVTLTATHEDFASSEPTVLELAPSESRNDLVLQLRVGATITGEVFDAKGKPISGQNVTIGRGAQGPFGGGEDSQRTGADGTFRFEHVDPGKITVTAMPSQEEMMKKMADSQDETAIMSMFSSMVTETVEVADGEETHVTLGQKAKDPVRIHGRVTEAGSPVTEAMVIAMNDGEGSIMEGMKAVRTDDSGSYDLEVDRPGSYVVNVQSENFGGSSIQFFIDVPEVAEIEKDFALPVGRIEGRVIGPDRKPVSGVVVNVTRDGGAMGLEEFDRGSETTKGDGTFSFEYRRPATYTLTVGSTMNFFTGQKSRYAAKVVSGIVVQEDQVVSGLEIQLDEPGTLEGKVVDNTGAAVSGVAIHARDEQGLPLTRISGVITDAAGKFKYEGLPEGNLTVTAQGSDLCSPESTSVRIQVGQTTNCEIEVEPGAYLVVQLLDDGEPVRARLRVLDENGREVSGLLSMAAMQELLSEGLSSKERRVGPVPPGKYTLEATTPDGKTAKKRVRMKPGDNKRLIKMRLKN